MDEKKKKSELDALIAQHKEAVTELTVAQQRAEMLKTNVIKIEGIIEYLRNLK